MKTDFVRARIETDLKNEVNSILHEMGITPTQAITMLYRKIKTLRRIPFSLSIPNDETVEAIEDARNNRNLVYCKNIDELFERLEI